MVYNYTGGWEIDYFCLAHVARPLKNKFLFSVIMYLKISRVNCALPTRLFLIM